MTTRGPGTLPGFFLLGLPAKLLERPGAGFLPFEAQGGQQQGPPCCRPATRPSFNVAVIAWELTAEVNSVVVPSQRVRAMSKHFGKVCRSYGDLLTASLSPVALVTTERWVAGIAFLTQQPDDNLPSGLSEQDERLLGGYRRAFGGRLDRSEANRLLGCLGWVQF